jgi:hypothetical protein
MTIGVGFYRRDPFGSARLCFWIPIFIPVVIHHGVEVIGRSIINGVGYIQQIDKVDRE